MYAQVESTHSMQSNGQYCAGNTSRIPASHQPQVYFTLPPPDRQVPENTQPSVSQAEPVGIVNDSQIRQTVGHTLTTATSLESLPTLPTTAAAPNSQSVPRQRPIFQVVEVKGEVPPLPWCFSRHQLLQLVRGLQQLLSRGIDNSASEAPERSAVKDATYYRPCWMECAKYWCASLSQI